jgi:hypothetical protein
MANVFHVLFKPLTKILEPLLNGFCNFYFK